VRLKWRFIVTKLARLRAASHTEDKDAASLRTFPVPNLHEPTGSNCHIARLASTMTLNVSLGGLLQV